MHWRWTYNKISLFYHIYFNLQISYFQKKKERNNSYRTINNVQKWTVILPILLFSFKGRLILILCYNSLLDQPLRMCIQFSIASHYRWHCRSSDSHNLPTIRWPACQHFGRNFADQMAACAANLARIRTSAVCGNAVPARSRFCAAESGQYAPGPARSWIAALWCEARRPRWSCARWAARTALRRRPRNSCRSATARPSTRATSSTTRCKRRWSIATGAPRADDCSARPHTWISIFPIAITPRLVLDGPRGLFHGLSSVRGRVTVP